VPFNQYLGRPEDLAAAVLEELPNQVTSFYRMIGKAPNLPSKPKKNTLHSPALLSLNTNYPTQ
jgi:hypothetical protein